MTDEDVEVDPIPTSALPEPARQEWRLIIASAVRDEPGSLTTVLVERGSTFWLASFLWYRPGSGFLASAQGAECDALRARVLAALQAAGKPVRHEPAPGQ